MERRLIKTPEEAARENAREVEEAAFARARHARYLEPRTVYHVISRVRGNLFLLRPDLEGKLRAIIAGVLAQAKQNYEGIANFATSVLSNHLHVLLAAMSGDPRHISDYMALLKREICRRWREEVGWNGSMWEGFEATAIITPDFQVRALRYVVSQSVKENLVEDPRQWPGFHCAESLSTGDPVQGVWFDGTAYGKAKHAELAKSDANRREIRRDDYIQERTFAFDQLPALGHLSKEKYRAEMTRMVDEVVEEGRRERRQTGNSVLGVEAICAQDPMTSRPVPLPDWFEERRRMIVWDDRENDEVKAYVGRYWKHQVQYRNASERWLQIEVLCPEAFPETCHVPGKRTRPIAHMEQGGG